MDSEYAERATFAALTSESALHRVASLRVALRRLRGRRLRSSLGRSILFYDICSAFARTLKAT